VERENGEEVRYVIDFYGGGGMKPASLADKGHRPVSIFLDVRPAVDSVSAVVSRLSFSWRQRFNPFSLPKWCLMGSPFFRAIEAEKEQQQRQQQQFLKNNSSDVSKNNKI
jgi:hypothetical protein